MNLTPEWVEVFQREGWDAIHWSDTGDPRAPDQSIMDWARANGCIVFTHDLDFGTLLALAESRGPSIVQLRAQDVLPRAMKDHVLDALRRYEPELKAGALLTVDQARQRIRLLPIAR